MKRFLFIEDVVSVSGTQTFYVDAETQEEALEILKSTGGTIYSNDYEITSYGDEPTFCGETTVDDHGGLNYEIHKN